MFKLCFGMLYHLVQTNIYNIQVDDGIHAKQSVSTCRECHQAASKHSSKVCMLGIDKPPHLINIFLLLASL